MRGYLAIGIACFVGSLYAGTALADRRVALVIGNSSYQHAPKLTNPENDANAISLLLRHAGFEVVETRQNLAGTEMRSMRDFSAMAADADIAVLFFAGHGIEVSGVNYLIPTDAALRKDIDVEDEAVSLDRVLTLLEPAKKLRLVILDACRDNPFVPKMSRTLASRAVGRGLGRVEPANSDTLIAYSAKAGSISADGSGTNSPFTTALLHHLTVPGLDIRLALGRVRDEVLRETGRKQEPFVYGALGGATIALSPASGDSSDTAASSPKIDADAAAARDYEAAAKVGTQAGWDAFIAKYPSGFYSDLAKAQRAKFASAPPAARPDGGKTDKPDKRPNAPATPADNAKEKEKKADKPRGNNTLEACLADYVRRKGPFVPEGQSTAYVKSRSDMTSMCQFAIGQRNYYWNYTR
jgi:uncharacterized caspase-like protein